MTKHQIKLVKTSWGHFRNINPEVVADAFYSKLFLDHPNLQKMFPKDMKEQYKKVVYIFNIVVARLDRFDELTADVVALGVRHKGYGVKVQHYKMVGDALLWTLENGLGSDWNEEVGEAWRTCYTILSDTMIKAMK